MQFLDIIYESVINFNVDYMFHIFNFILGYLRPPTRNAMGRIVTEEIFRLGSRSIV